MKTLLINGSPHADGNTAAALKEVARRLEENGIDTEIEWIGAQPVRGCIACYKCYNLGHCIFTDELYTRIYKKMSEADALVVGSPTYYAGPNGSLCALLDRLFYSAQHILQNKPAAAVAVCRRGGASTTFERLNKYFQISNMPQATSQYWNIVYGRKTGDAEFDKEGMQTMRTLADNLAWMMKALPSVPVPEREPWSPTHFIRKDLTE